MRMTVKKTIISDLLIFLYFCVILGDALNLGILNMITLGAFAYYFISGGKGLKSLGRSPYFLWLVIFTGYIFLGMIWASSRASAFNMGKTFLKMSIMMFFVYLNTTSLEKLIFRIKQFLCATVFMLFLLDLLICILLCSRGPQLMSVRLNGSITVRRRGCCLRRVRFWVSVQMVSWSI